MASEEGQRVGSGTVYPQMPPHKCVTPYPYNYEAGTHFKCDCGNNFVLKETDTYDPREFMSGGTIKSWVRT